METELKTIQRIEPCLDCGMYAAVQSKGESHLVCMHCGTTELQHIRELAIWPCLQCKRYAAFRDKITNTVICMNCD